MNQDEREGTILENVFGEYQAPKPSLNARFKKWRAKAGTVVANSTLFTLKNTVKKIPVGLEKLAEWFDRSPVLTSLSAVVIGAFFLTFLYPSLTLANTFCISTYILGFGVGFRSAVLLKEFTDPPSTDRRPIILMVVSALLVTLPALFLTS